MNPARTARILLGLLVATAGSSFLACTDEQAGPSSLGKEEAKPAPQPTQQPVLEPVFRVHRDNVDLLMSLPGVVGTGVGLTADGRPAIKVFAAGFQVAGLPTRLEGFPVERLVTGRFFADDCTPTTCTNADVWPLPVPIGVSTGINGSICNFGTIGARVKAGASVYALSNNHIYALENTVPLGAAALQPGLGDRGCSPTTANAIGTLSAYSPILFCGGSCPNNAFDAAIAVSTTSKLDRKTPPSGYGTPNSLPWAPVTLSAPMKMYGRTSSLVAGSVVSIGAVVTVSYRRGNARFIGQILVGGCPSLCSKPGDSGALWVSGDATANPIGLHFASSTSGGTTYAVASPVGPVLSYFGLTVDGNPAPPTATGGFTANCGITCSDNRITSVTASSNLITVRGSGGSGTITLTGATASGGLSASCGITCGNAAITSVTASGGNTITVRDNAGHVGTITLSGATAIRGLAANCGITCSNGRLTGLTANGVNGIFITDNAGHKDYLKFQ